LFAFRTYSVAAIPVELAVLACAAITGRGQAAGAETERLAGTAALDWQGDLAARMVEGIDRFLMRELDASVERRARHWNRNYSSPEAYAYLVQGNRLRFQKIIGATDPRLPVAALELVASTSTDSLVAETDRFRVLAVRWPVLEGVHGEGLLLEPKGEARAQIVAVPDADWTPEMLVGLAEGVAPAAQFARRLAEAGCRVVVPTLIDRRDTWSGNPAIRMTNQPHREFIYRQAFEMGRHVIGYEVQKVLAAVDWFAAENRRLGKNCPVAVAGCGEGGLIAFYSAALDTRIAAALVSGYFQKREGVWREPIYRNVWALLDEFGDAEIASMIAPRVLVVEACRGPEVSGPPPERAGRRGAAPGELATPPLESVRAEFNRVADVFQKLGLKKNLQLAVSGKGDGPPGSESALRALLAVLGVNEPLAPSSPSPLKDRRGNFDASKRSKSQFDELVAFTQNMMRQGEVRRFAFWAMTDPSSLDRWQQSCRWHRDYFWDEVIGRFPPADIPPNPRTRTVFDEPRWKGYEVALDVWPDVFAYGILLVPKDIKPGERRPVVVCQHGLEGRPDKVVDPKIVSPYHSCGAKLADEGFVVYAPQNPYIGGDKFRVLQRKANPLKKSLFSVIVRQHERTIEWLSQLPFADPKRIAFYGLSYGGKTAMRVPALLDGYCLSICSGDFNEWIWKNVSTTSSYSYMFTGEYEMFEFDLGNTFNYAEIAGLIAPRPFMVERGHRDGVAPDEWVAYEYAKVKRFYTFLGIPDRTEIEFFNGPHEIHGVGTFQFLHRQLGWPEKGD
jgi:dienelactone hydrolase